MHTNPQGCSVVDQQHAHCAATDFQPTLYDKQPAIVGVAFQCNRPTDDEMNLQGELTLISGQVGLDVFFLQFYILIMWYSCAGSFPLTFACSSNRNNYKKECREWSVSHVPIRS